MTLIVVALGFLNVWKHQLVSLSWFKDNKDALAALNSIVTVFLLIAGGLFSDYRFFRGRTLSSRAELAIAVSVHETPEQFLLHAILLTAKNVGSGTIWEPKPTIHVQIHGPSDKVVTRRITDWWEEDEDEDGTAPVIEAGETVSFFAHQRIPKDAWAVTYRTSLAADSGDIWFVAKTVSNRASDKAS